MTIDPPDSDGFTALDIWLLFCIIMSFLSLLEYFVCICMGVRKKVDCGESEKGLLAADKEVGASSSPRRRPGIADRARQRHRDRRD
jgi:hypothetical protein